MTTTASVQQSAQLKKPHNGQPGCELWRLQQPQQQLHRPRSCSNEVEICCIPKRDLPPT